MSPHRTIHTTRLYRWRILAAAGALIATPALASPAAHAAAEPDGGFAPLAARAAVSALTAAGASRSDAVRRVNAQPERVALADRLSRQLGARSAGAYLHRRTGAVVVTVVDEQAARIVRTAGATAQQVRHTAADLDAAIKHLNRAVRVRNTAWAIDVATNQVVLTISDSVDRADAARVGSVAASLGGIVRVERVAGPLMPMLAGGDEIVASAGWICSAGFNTTRSGGNFVVTAGHCTEGFPSWRTGSTNIGPTTNSDFPVNDYGLIQNTGAPVVAGVNLYNGSIQSITSSSSGSVGQSVCKSGRTTQVTCGTISALNATVNYGNGDIVYGLIQTNVRAAGGDSGGPLFAGSTGVGLTSGGNSTTTYFQPLPEALSAYGVALLGGGPSPGTGRITGIGGKCVDVNQNNSADGTAIQLWDCNGTTAQQWTRQGSTIRALGKCLDVQSSGTANGTLIQLWTCNGSGAQNWTSQSDGALRNPQSNRCLDAPGGNTANGTRLIIWDCHGGANQRWQFS
jgi:hypothetical protein